jgi:ATP-binding cassette, subfamily C, bacterial CydD
VPAVDPRLLRASPAARRFAIACVPLGVATAAAVIAQAVLLGRIVADVFLDGRTLSAEMPLLVGLAAASVARGVLAWGFEAGGHLAAASATSDLRRQVVGHVLLTRPADPGEATGDVAAAVLHGVDALDPYFAKYLPQLALAASVPAAILVWVALHDLDSAAVMLVTLPLIPVFGVLVGKASARRAEARYAALSRLGGHFLDVVRGLPTLRAFNRGRAQVGRLAQTADAYRRETMGTLRVAFLSAFVLELAAMIGTALVAVEIGIRLDDGRIALATAFAVLVLTPELYAPLRSAAAQFHASTDGIAAADALLSRLEMPPPVPFPEAPVEPLDPRDVPVRLRSVSFTYPGRDAEALADVNLALSPGERVAVVGPSGSGKSTLIRLLLRFDRPGRGRILVGGIDLDDVDPDPWRQLVAWLPQRPQLGAGTIADAIGLGDPAASRRRVVEAARRAGAHTFVAELPEGYNTRVGDGGAGLSAGQVRRIAMARALLRDAALLLLDEPTTNLDAASAGRIGDALAALPRGATMLLATHDLALADRVADRVVWMRDGSIEAITPGAAHDRVEEEP